MPKQKSRVRLSEPQLFPDLWLIPDPKAYQQDRQGFIAVTRLLIELNSRHQVPFKSTAPILERICEYLPRWRPSMFGQWSLLFKTPLRAGQKRMKLLAREIQRYVAKPEPPQPIDEKISQHWELKQALEALRQGLQLCERIITAQKFHGHSVASTGRFIMDLLTVELANKTLAAKYTQKILSAWDHDSAPTSYQHLRTSHLERKRRRVRRSSR